MKIGALAEAVGVGIQTIRFYEQQGLLPNPPRGPSGFRPNAGVKHNVGYI